MSLPRAAASLALALLLAGCAATSPTPSTAGLADVMQRPAEGKLLAGMRSYDDGQYEQAEGLLRESLRLGLASGRDRATAHKLLAFILCTSDRLEGCEAEFRAARQADPAFALGRAEAGHPIWGPVYRRLAPS